MHGQSLSTRLLIAVSLLLAVFFGATSWVLDEVFQETSRKAISDRLDVESLALIAASEEAPGRMLTPDKQLVDPRFMQPNSGLYAEVWAGDKQLPWRSPSLLGNELKFNRTVHPGQRKLAELTASNGTRVMALSVGLSWEFTTGKSRNMVFSVAESMEHFYAQQRSFRFNLFGGFAVMSLLLLAALALMFRRVLQPLRQLETEIAGIEAGDIVELSAGYPRELVGVTENMNMLLRGERERLARYRKSLGNLAHSLKTPLSVMRNVLSERSQADEQAVPAEQIRHLDEQVDRMDEIVRYQLKRAAASAGLALGTAALMMNEVAQPLVKTLQKVYLDRHMHCEMQIANGCAFSGDRGDLMEILGNLLDNAFKYGRSQVQLHISNIAVTGSRRPGLLVIVEDDGPGIPADQRNKVLERGTRLDERAIGQGIGLSVVKELAELYRGTVTISESSLGGACVRLELLGA